MKRTEGLLRQPLTLRLTIAGILLGTVFFLFTGCGIASYPYLVPPEKISAGNGFQHKKQVTSGVFQGYEIYYRIYAGTVSEDTIADDLQTEFQYRSGFEKVSGDRDRSATLNPGEISTVDSPYWLAVASTKDTAPDSNLEGTIGLNSPPLFPFEQTYGETNNFDVSMSATASSARVEISILDSGYPTTGNPKNIYLYRRISENGKTLGFTDNKNDYIATSESDGHADVPDEASDADKVTIAFFSIIYGFDIGSFTTIFANSHLGQPAKNIVFMGTVVAD